MNYLTIYGNTANDTDHALYGGALKLGVLRIAVMSSATPVTITIANTITSMEQ